jgi:hypothetical protein
MLYYRALLFGCKAPKRLLVAIAASRALVVSKVRTGLEAVQELSVHNFIMLAGVHK